MIVTYQDFLKHSGSEQARQLFYINAIRQHKGSDEYKTAYEADMYFRHQNITINSYQKFLNTIEGRKVPDAISPNYKMACNFYKRLIIQENSFLLGNGVSFKNQKTKDKLGNDFDFKVQEAGKDALNQAVSFGFWNYDHLEEFELLNFVPLWDEDNGALRAGIRFWQIDIKKPMRIIVYEEDGITDYLYKNNVWELLSPKKSYMTNFSTTKAGGDEIYDGQNYKTFPIVPFWANSQKQSEIVGIKEQIDAYDLIKSGFINDLDGTAQIYWILENCGGMEDADLVKFRENLKTIGVASLEDENSRLNAQTVEIPYNAREAILNRLERDIYNDFMGFDIAQIASGNTVNAQIMAVYEPLNEKTDDYEYNAVRFIEGILNVAGIDDTPTFTRSMLNNSSEMLRNILSASDYLSDEYKTRKILKILGDGEMAEGVLAEIQKNEGERYGQMEEEEKEEDENV